MRLNKWRLRQSGLAAVLLWLSPGHPALARDREHWPEHWPVLRKTWSETAERPRQPSSIGFLSPRDRQNLADAKVRSATIDSGTASLTVVGGRARSSKTAGEGRLPSDRYSVREAGLAGHIDLLPGLSLIASGRYALMKRRPEICWNEGRRLATGMASTGLALGTEEGKFALDYVSISTGVRSETERMAEIMGGAPLAGQGLQLSVSGMSDVGNGTLFHWSVSGASMSRRDSDSAIVGRRPGGQDQRLSITLQGSF